MADNERAMGLTDPLFQDPYVDLDEWRDEPVRHRYVHGGFHGSDCRFSDVLPRGAALPGTVLPSGHARARHGARARPKGSTSDTSRSRSRAAPYLVESNLGLLRRALPGEDSTIAGFRASAAVATYSRVLAAEMYGEHRPVRLRVRRQRRRVPHDGVHREHPRRVGRRGAVHPRTPMSMPSRISGCRRTPCACLRDKLPQIVDARRTGWQRRHVRRPHRRGARRARGGDPHGLPAASVVRRRADLPAVHDDLGGALRPHGQVGPRRTSTTSGPSPATSARTRPIRCVHAQLQHKTKVVQAVMAPEAVALGLPMPLAMAGQHIDDVPVAFRARGPPRRRPDRRDAAVHERRGRRPPRLDLRACATAT